EQLLEYLPTSGQINNDVYQTLVTLLGSDAGADEKRLTVIVAGNVPLPLLDALRLTPKFMYVQPLRMITTVKELAAITASAPEPGEEDDAAPPIGIKDALLKYDNRHVVAATATTQPSAATML